MHRNRPRIRAQRSIAIFVSSETTAGVPKASAYVWSMPAYARSSSIMATRQAKAQVFARAAERRRSAETAYPAASGCGRAVSKSSRHPANRRDRRQGEAESRDRARSSASKTYRRIRDSRAGSRSGRPCHRRRVRRASAVHDRANPQSTISRPLASIQVRSFKPLGPRLLPPKNCGRRKTGCARRSAIRSRTNAEELGIVALFPTEPADLVVLAVRIVVAHLRVVELIAGEQHRQALREQQRREHVALLLRAQVLDALIVGRRLPRRNSNYSSHRDRRDCLRDWLRCACDRSSRDRSA